MKKEKIMKAKWLLFTSIFQILMGISAIVGYILVFRSGESLIRWTVTLFLGIAFIIRGTVDIVKWKKLNKVPPNFARFHRANNSHETEHFPIN